MITITDILTFISIIFIFIIWNEISKEVHNKTLKDRLFNYADDNLLTARDHDRDLEESLRVANHLDRLTKAKQEIESRYGEDMVDCWTETDRLKYENIHLFLSGLQKDQKEYAEKLAAKRNTRVFLITAIATVLLVAVTVIKI